MAVTLLDALMIGLIVTVVAMTLTFTVMGLLILIVTLMTPPATVDLDLDHDDDRPIKLSTPNEITEETAIPVVISAAISTFLEQEQQMILKSRPIVSTTGDTRSPWANQGRMNALRHTSRK